MPLVEHKGNTYFVRVSTYFNDRKALIFYDRQGSIILKATVNAPGYDIDPSEVIIRDFGETEGVLRSLLKAKIVAFPTRWVKVGPTHAPICYLKI